VLADAGEVVVQGTTGHQVVLCVHFKETQVGLMRMDVQEVLGFEAEPGPVGQCEAAGLVGEVGRDRRCGAER
jgi:hypothetical protein